MSDSQKVPLGAALLAILSCALVPVIPYVINVAGRDGTRLMALEQKSRDLEMRLERARSAERKLSQFHAVLARLKKEAAKPPCTSTQPAISDQRPANKRISE